jgi:hypothetical protein
MVSRLKLISKNNKACLSNDNMTIDAKHSEMINHFKNLQDSIPSLKDELKKMISEYNNKDPSKKNDIDYIIYKDNLREKINNMKEKINSIINNDEQNKYYLDVGILLHNYYDNIETSKNDKNNSELFEENLMNYDNFDEEYDEEYDDEETEDAETEDTEDAKDSKDSDKSKKNIKKQNYKSVLNFFNDREAIENENNLKYQNSNTEELFSTEDLSEDNSKKNTSSQNLLNDEELILKGNANLEKTDGVYTSMKISDFVKQELTFKKKDILEEYLQKIDPTYVSRIRVDVNISKCTKCNLEMTLFPSDGIQICESCGLQQNILIESDKPSFKDPPMEVCYFSYKRINHYNESVQTTKICINEYNYFINKIVYLLKFMQII